MQSLSILTLLMATFFSFSIQSAERFERKEKELFRKNHRIHLNLNKKSVRCSDLGYGNVQLKISVNDLEWISFFDHSNTGEAEPCMTAGMMSCRQSGFSGIDLDDFILDPNKKAEDDILSRFRAIGAVEADLEQILKEQLYIDHQEQKCTRTIHWRLLPKLMV